MEQLQISATERAKGPRNQNRRLRRSGQVPAVIYGGQVENRLVTLDHHVLELILRGASMTNNVFQIQVGGAAEQAIIRDMERHPVTNRLVHIDFLRVDLEKEIEVSVPIHAKGLAIGVKDGGILEYTTRAVEVRCLPLNVPRVIEIDVTGVGINQTLHLSDLTLPEGVEMLDDPETPILSVLPPKAEVEPTPAETAAEPEVIGEKKKEEEEEKEKK